MARDQVAVRGRDQELAALRDALQDSADRGRLVVVRGPAGIGRTALVNAAARGWRSAGVRVLCAIGAGSGDVFGVAAVLSAVRDQFEQLADLRLADSISALSRLATAEENPRWWMSSMASELGVLFDHIGQLGRTVLVIDDAHLVAEPALVSCAARRRGCLVVATCRDDIDPTPAMVELSTLADEVIDLAPLADDGVASVITRSAGIALDDALLSALRAALGPLFGNPGTALSTLGDLRSRGRLVVLRERLCLRDPAAPITLPANHDLLERARGLGELAPRLLTAVAAFDEFAVDDLPLLAETSGEDLTDCGHTLDRLVELGVLVADARGRVRCRCVALAAFAVEHAGAQVRRLHGAVVTTLLGNRRLRASVEPAVLADHMARAGVDLVAGPAEVAWLVGRADAARWDEPERAACWYAAALRFLPVGEPEHARVLASFLRLLVRTGRYELLSEVVGDHDAIRLLAPASRADLRAAAMLASVHTGRVLPRAVVVALADEQPSGGDPLDICGWWFGQQDLFPAPSHHAPEPMSSDPVRPIGTRPLLSAAELDLIRHALSGDPEAGSHAWRRARHGQPAAEIDQLVEAGAVGDLATVFEIVLGPDYRVPRTGPLAAYQRVVRGYANADWSAAMSGARELALTGSPDTLAHHAARLFAAEICSARGELQRAAEWLADVTPETASDVRLAALRGWVESGVLHRTGDSRQATSTAWRTYRRMRQDGVRAGVERLLARAVEIAMSGGDRHAAADLLVEIEEVNRSGFSRTAGEIFFLARGVVHGDLTDALASAEKARHRGHRPELLRACLAVAQLAEDPQPWLHEAYEVAQQCGSPLLRERIRAVTRQRGVTTPQVRGPRTTFSSIELRIIALIGDGLTNRRIASAIQVSEKAVENHLTRLFARTGCRSRVELAAASLTGRLAKVAS